MKDFFRRVLRRLQGIARKARRSRVVFYDIDAQLPLEKIEPGTRLVFLTPNVPDTVRKCLDLDALVREADTIRKEPKEPQTLSLPLSSIGRYLREDVTQREASLLTELLSRLGECRVEIPAERDSSGSTVRGVVHVWIIPGFSCEHYSRFSGGGRGCVISPLPPAGFSNERRA